MRSRRVESMMLSALLAVPLNGLTSGKTYTCTGTATNARGTGPRSPATNGFVAAYLRRPPERVDPFARASIFDPRVGRETPDRTCRPE
jgi:hypothetical protein